MRRGGGATGADPAAGRVITIDPVGRTEGHLGITITVRHGEIVHAAAFAPLYRGFEKIMVGRDPRDAQDLPTRICGVCPMVHSVCGSKNLEMLFGRPYNANARIMRNLAHATHMIGDHILHFYHLAGLDFARGPDAEPFAPRYEGDYRLPAAVNERIIEHYICALRVRRLSHEAAALFAGKLPHAISFVPGGMTVTPTRDIVRAWSERIEVMGAFVHDAWQRDVESIAEHYPDYARIGGGATNYLSMGVFELDAEDREHFYPRGVFLDGERRPFDLKHITEDVAHTWQDGEDGRHPFDPDLKAVNPDKEGGYSYMTAARYDGKAMEVGPFARMKIAGHMDGDSSVLARHRARVLEAMELLEALPAWAAGLELGQRSTVDVPPVPKSAVSHGMSEAPRGACAHFMKVAEGRISHWQSIPATNWNGSPRDARERPGPFELALAGTPVRDPENPIEAVRVVRSFDPCMACSVHVIHAGRQLGPYVVTA